MLHAACCRFRYLLHLDGITASSRLAKLMRINSPILKQASLWVEYYSRYVHAALHHCATPVGSGQRAEGAHTSEDVQCFLPVHQYAWLEGASLAMSR